MHYLHLCISSSLSNVCWKLQCPAVLGNDWAFFILQMNIIHNLSPRFEKMPQIILIVEFYFFIWQRELNSRYLVLLSTSHHVEEEVYTAFIDNGHPLQESYLIYKET